MGDGNTNLEMFATQELHNSVFYFCQFETIDERVDNWRNDEKFHWHKIVDTLW